jgi:hypothetical protein
MSSQDIVSEPGIGRVIPQHNLQPVRRRASFRCQPSDRYPVSGDHDRLAMLDGVEEVSEVPRRLGGSHRNHEYILSDLLCIYVDEGYPHAPPVDIACST